jgi:tetratricopeptide (TPR) repeat protein
MSILEPFCSTGSFPGLSREIGLVKSRMTSLSVERLPLRAENVTGSKSADAPLNLFLRARALIRLGEKEAALRFLREAGELDPTFCDAIEAEGEILDTAGTAGGGAVLYAQAREIRRKLRRGGPDRHFVMRQQGPAISEVVAYTAVIKSLKKSALPLVARGNAYLVEDQPDLALADYDRALKLKPGSSEILALKAEALVALGRYREALDLLNSVLEGGSPYSGSLNTRAIAKMALGYVEQANADWKLQLSILKGRPQPSSYIALRLADYEAAIPYLEAASADNSRDAYSKLYLNTARLMTGRPPLTESVAAPDGWPELLLALQAGAVTEDAVLAKAYTIGRRAEALFQLAALKFANDPAAARSHWREIVETGPHDFVEFAASRNEFARAL